MKLAKSKANRLLSSLIIVFIVGFFSYQSLAQDSRNSENTKPKHFKRAKIEAGNAVRDCGPFNASSNIRQTPDCTDTRFWVDVAPGLDTGCTYNDESPLSFTINIDRYIGDFDRLKSNNLIGGTVILRIPAFDVDYNGSGTNNQPERDRLWINDHEIGYLQGNDDVWHLNEFVIPVEWLNFPTSQGKQGVNNLKIEIDTLNGDWCVGADWAAVDIEVARPALFVHGILSFPDNWTQIWVSGTNEDYEIANTGLPADTINVDYLPDTIENNSAKIAARVEKLKNYWKVDKINLIGHSKGGLDSRDYAEFSDSVSQVIQIGTPNAGSLLANDIIAGSVLLPSGLLFNAAALIAAPGGYQLTTPQMANYNANHGYNREVRYTALAGIYTPDPSCILCLDLFRRPLVSIVGEGDLVVAQSSVHSQSFTRNLTVSTLSPLTETIHTNQRSSQLIKNALKPVYGLLDSTENPVQANLQMQSAVQPPPAVIKASTETGAITQGQRQTRTITVDQTSNVFFSMKYYSGNLDMALISPSGQRFDRTTIQGNPNVFAADDEILGGRMEVFSFNTLEAGAWTIEIDGVSIIEPSGEIGYAVTAWMPANSPISLAGSFQNSNVRAGSPLKLLAKLSNDITPVTNANVTAVIQLPNRTKQNVTLFDNGTNGDATPDDGIYSFDFTNTVQVGSYQILFDAERIAGGNLPAFSREVLSTASVSASGSSLTGIYSDFGLDTNSNSLFNQLVVRTGVNVTNAGNFRLLGTLTDAQGNTLSAVKRVSLNPGNQNVQLEFDGEQIYRNRVNGSFMLTSLKLLEENGTGLSLLDERTNAYQTSSYQFLNFEHLPIAYTGTGTAIGIDTNANNRFDILRVTLGIDVTEADVYNWTAQLIDRNGTDLGFATGSGSLTSGTNNIVFNFNGATIGRNNVDGPYIVTGLLVYNEDFSLIEGNVLNTPPFHASQFEGSTIITPAVRLFDFDGDRKTDLSVFRPNLGEWWYRLSSNETNRAFQFGTNTDRIVPADFTGDGKTDIAFFRPSTGFWYVLRSEDSSFYAFPFGVSGDIPAPADYDGDSKADAAVFRPENGTWYISKSSGGITFQQFGRNGDYPVTADYDGDGKADIAIWRANVGEWWYQRSSDGTHRAYQFGTNTDKPMPGDYTGDGKADIAFYRTSYPGTGNWFILRSEEASYYSFPFGTTGDIPASGDYDGDGKFDAAVFRPGEGNWYVNRSSAGILISSFGANGDIPLPNAFVP